MEFLSSCHAFDDTISSLRKEYADDHSDALVICGAHDFSYNHNIDEFKKNHSKVIVFNQEPFLATQRMFLHQRYFLWLKEADEVWDYDEANMEATKRIRPDVKLHILKPFMDWSKYAKVPKDIDILFYGAMNDHRKTVIDALSKKYKVVIPNAFGEDLDQYIMRSKILLNIHYYYECALQEQARMIRWIGSPCRIISEPSRINYLGVDEISYKEIEKI